MSTGAPIGAIIAIKRRRIIDAFRAAGATSPQSALLPGEHGIKESFIFKRLIHRGVLVPDVNGRYYLDEVNELKDRKRRRTLVLLILVILIVLMAVGAIGIN